MKRGVMLVALLAAGCTINTPARRAPAVYDLGEAPKQAMAVAAPAFDGTLLVPPVVAPAALDTTRIGYRYAYDDPRQLRAYADSRWAATPATLMTEALRSRYVGAGLRVVGPVDGAQARRVLRIALEDYVQTFGTPTASRVRVQARATLLDAHARAVIAQETFAIARDAAPDAAGAASALAGATHALIDELLDWTRQNLNNMPLASTADRSPR